MAGCVVDIGHGKIDVAAVSEGITQAPGAARLSFAGEQLTQLLGQLLQQQQQQQQQPLLPHQLGALKTQCCRAASSQAAYQIMLKQQQQQQLQQNGERRPAAPTSSSNLKGLAVWILVVQGSSSSNNNSQVVACRQYTLPDGSKFTITTEGFTTAEALFDPTLLGQSTPGLVDCILEVVSELPDASIERSVSGECVAL